MGGLPKYAGMSLPELKKSMGLNFASFNRASRTKMRMLSGLTKA
jgi:hypothetical protein